MDTVRQRLGPPVFQERLELQDLRVGRYHAPPHRNPNFLRWLLRLILRGTGTYAWGNRNYRALRVVANRVLIDTLPLPFEGYRILQISDLHFGLDDTLLPILLEKIEPLQYDLCCITGDFVGIEETRYSECYPQIARLASLLRGPVYGVLGNHDRIEMVPELERLGIRMLLNETVVLERGDSTIYLSGADDPYFPLTNNVETVARQVPPDATALLITHMPDGYQDASACGYRLMLAGHTHGGQICLPGGFVLLRNTTAPARLLNGAWREGKLNGYTSPGAGACGVPVRFACPPEITVHELVSGTNREATALQTLP